VEYDIVILIEVLVSLFKAFYHSSFFLGLKILAGIYLAVLLLDVVLLLILKGVSAKYRVGLRGADVPVISKKKLFKSWAAIVARLESKNASQYKVAIIEADALAEEFLSGVGYKGENMTQKLEQVGQSHLDEHRETLTEVHKLRNRIVHEADFEVDYETAKEALAVYENFLKYLDFL